MGSLPTGVPIEAVNWRVLISGPVPQIDMPNAPATGDDKPIAMREVRFSAEAAPVQTPVYRREKLANGWSAQGPLIIEEAASTTVALPGWHARVADGACLLLVRIGDRG